MRLGALLAIAPAVMTIGITSTLSPVHTQPQLRTVAHASRYRVSVRGARVVSHRNARRLVVAQQPDARRVTVTVRSR